MKRILILIFCPIWVLAFSCNHNQTPGEEPEPGPDPVSEIDTVVTCDDFELSYWVDCDLMGYHRRGYWYTYSTQGPENAPSDVFIENGIKMLCEEYQANLLYVFYHRQFEMETAKKVMLKWKEESKKYNVKIVPTVLLQDYSNYSRPADGPLNFTDAELVEFAVWCKQNICDEFGIFDVYTRQGSGQPQDAQLKTLWNEFGNHLVLVGLQPNVTLNSKFVRGVEDTWTAECQGNTNALWSNPLGGQNVGKNLLDNWVKERAQGERRQITFDLIPVAWDYEETTSRDRYGYICPGDNAAYNDPPIPGRLHLCKDAILAHYDNPYEHAQLGGFSCDLTILHANSTGCGRDKKSYYMCLRSGIRYEGYFSSATDEIAEVYKAVKEDYVQKMRVNKAQ